MAERPTLIGITGYAQVGKDTAADYLNRVYGYDRLAFADALRRLTERLNPLVALDAAGDGLAPYNEVVAAAGYERAKVEVPGVRQFLKDLGNGAREVLGADVWVSAVMRSVRFGQSVVVSDVRFLNEAAAIRNFHPKSPGIIIRIVRPDHDAESAFEREVAQVQADFEVHNNGSITDLYNRLSGVMRDLGQDAWHQPSLLAG